MVQARQIESRLKRAKKGEVGVGLCTRNTVVTVIGIHNKQHLVGVAV